LKSSSKNKHNAVYAARCKITHTEWLWVWQNNIMNLQHNFADNTLQCSDSVGCMWSERKRIRPV